MGLLDRLFRRMRTRLGPWTRTRREGPGDWLRSLPPKPEDIQEAGENSPVVIFRQGKTTIILDRDAFDYAYGGARGPDPAQRDLDALLPGVTRVCVLEGAMLRGRAMGGRVLLDTRDPGAIRDLMGCLRIVENPSTYVMVPAVLSPRLVKVATPPTTVTVVVPVSEPGPLPIETVMAVLLSDVSRLPLASSS